MFWYSIVLKQHSNSRVQVLSMDEKEWVKTQQYGEQKLPF